MNSFKPKQFQHLICWNLFPFNLLTGDIMPELTTETKKALEEIVNAINNIDEVLRKYFKELQKC